MKSKAQIIELMNILEYERNRFVENDMPFLALSIGSQIQILKWIIENEN